MKKVDRFKKRDYYIFSIVNGGEFDPPPPVRTPLIGKHTLSPKGYSLPFRKEAVVNLVEFEAAHG